jgi:hypothetical protein
MNRRTFMQRAPLTAIGLRLAFGASTIGIALSEAGCNVFTDILNWVPVGEAAVNSVLAVLTGNGVLISPAMQAIVTLVEAAFADLAAAVKEYQSTTPAPVGALAKIEAAFKSVVDNFGAFLKTVNAPTGVVAIIVGLAQVVFSTIAAFMNQLPAASSLRRTVVIGTTVQVGSQTAPVVPKLRSRRAFKHDFNAVLDTAPKVGAIAPTSAYLPISFWEHL